MLRQITLDFADGASLSAGQSEGQVQPVPKRSIASKWLPFAVAVAFPDQHQCQAVGEQFVIGQPVARGRVFVAVSQEQRIAPRRPFLPVD